MDGRVSAHCRHLRRLVDLEQPARSRPSRRSLERSRKAGLEHNARMEALKILGLFVTTAGAEIVGCYLPYLWLKEGKSVCLLVPAALSLALFAWLLAPPSDSGGYAAYRGVYIGAAKASPRERR